MPEWAVPSIAGSKKRTIQPAAVSVAVLAIAAAMLAFGCASPRSRAGGASDLRGADGVSGTPDASGGGAGPDVVAGASVGPRPDPVPAASVAEDLLARILVGLGEPPAGRVRTVEVRPLASARPGEDRARVGSAADAWERLRAELNRAGLGRVRFVPPSALPSDPSAGSGVDATLEGVWLDPASPGGGSAMITDTLERDADPSPSDGSTWILVRFVRSGSAAPAFSSGVAVARAAR